MRLAIMQPYFFPYLGYFQLIASVNKFVFYDDVNFIKNGWINRNRVCAAGAPRYITVPLSAASPFQKINQIMVQPGELWRKKMLEGMRHTYSKAPNFRGVFELFSEVLTADEPSMACLAKNSVRAVSDYLGLQTEFVMTSAAYGNTGLSGAARVIDICIKENATDYYNPPGGKELYDADEFTSAGLGLHFVTPQLPQYRQFSKEFIPGLSIIDVLMFADTQEAKEMVAGSVCGG
ncbi:WbqC family protein [Massilia glaciei]|uniref:Glycine transferase n=1 Tax=Massilia glaciei TaxID=1524097 RepID=A0A2U2HN23_9BURK|nr:WbqC family protein [Massilia glaciei]PWF48908.1 hypothetical protein C7C56_009320 [Massilia glaciei]